MSILFTKSTSDQRRPASSAMRSRGRLKPDYARRQFVKRVVTPPAKEFPTATGEQGFASVRFHASAAILRAPDEADRRRKRKDLVEDLTRVAKRLA